jgi:hypothetical protein
MTFAVIQQDSPLWTQSVPKMCPAGPFSNGAMAPTLPSEIAQTTAAIPQGPVELVGFIEDVRVQQRRHGQLTHVGSPDNWLNRLIDSP